MTKIFFLCIGFLGFMLSAKAQAPADDKSPVITFQQDVHDFGQQPEGPEYTHTFKFKNTGNAPLKLLSVAASCGCTTPKWSTEEVAPGKSGEITVTYNSSGRPGPFTKMITVKTNGIKESIKVLTIKGTIGG